LRFEFRPPFIIVVCFPNHDGYGAYSEAEGRAVQPVPHAGSGAATNQWCSICSNDSWRVGVEVAPVVLRRGRAWPVCGTGVRRADAMHRFTAGAIGECSDVPAFAAALDL